MENNQEEGHSRDWVGTGGVGSGAAKSSTGPFDSMEIDEALKELLFQGSTPSIFEELESPVSPASGMDFITDVIPIDPTPTVAATENHGVVTEAGVSDVGKLGVPKPKSQKGHRGAKKKTKKTAKVSKARGRPRKVTAAEIAEIAKKVVTKKKQNRVKKKNVSDEEKTSEYLAHRAKNNKAAQRSRAKRRMLDAVHMDSWSHLFEGHDMTPEQRLVMMEVRAEVGVQMLRIWDLAYEYARKEFEGRG